MARDREGLHRYFRGETGVGSPMRTSTLSSALALLPRGAFRGWGGCVSTERLPTALFLFEPVLFLAAGLAEGLLPVLNRNARSGCIEPRSFGVRIGVLARLGLAQHEDSSPLENPTAARDSRLDRLGFRAIGPAPLPPDTTADACLAAAAAAGVL